MANEIKEFKITTDLTTVKQQIISANFEEVKVWLQENLAPYVDMVVQEEDIPAAKAYRANIRKVRDRIDECRKEAKAAALAPYQEFELRAKQLTGLCDSAANALDIQVKAFEEKEAAAKVGALLRFYNDEIGSREEIVQSCLSWEQVYNAKWRNKTFSIEAAQKEITDAIGRVELDIAAIRDMGARDPAYLFDYYRETHNLALVLKKASELDHIRQLEESASKPKSRGGIERELYEAATGKEEPTVRQIDFRVWATDVQIRALATFLRENGIKYGRAE